MKIQMKVEMSGTRNGVEWPAVGGEVDLPDGEAAKLCAAGLAIPVAKKDAGVEKREKQERAEAAAERQDEAERQHVESHEDSDPDAGPKRRAQKRETAKRGAK